VGERDSEGVFHPTAGNIHHDRAGMGYLSYKEARELVKHCNECCDDNLIIIVLTIAHLDHDTGNNEYENLRALCQRCHNQHDAEYRKNNRRKKVKNQTELDLWTLGA
jgi:5-methylcytosine-specific restriction endonuclease McrA